ncbi:predicted protein [Botrytis cinerea T4]|uniref:Uncharacterized protein n=1 Tax=Botryotinia fuckeliana (strain T4) TaxID=999810 RepID=G2XUC4_BOTF4|nr:predicted protein [Botrytis cinerea T4]
MAANSDVNNIEFEYKGAILNIPAFPDTSVRFAAGVLPGDSSDVVK